MINKNLRLPLIVFILIFLLLAFVQVKLERPMILAERFLNGAGWVEIFRMISHNQLNKNANTIVINK